MPTNKQRRDAARRHLERQLERRQEREVRRRKFTLVGSIVGTLVLIGVIVLVISLATSDDKKKTTAGGSGTSPTATPTPTSSPAPSPAPSTSYPPATGASVTFDGVTVKGATDLKGVPGVTSKSTTGPAKLEIKDLVVGKGAVATTTSTVNVQYYGLLYRNGKEFDSSWSRGAPTSFSLTGVVPGFTKGIGGTTGIPPMKVGGRRIIIMPASDAYGSQSNDSIPANSPLVFIVDLLSVTAATPSSSASSS